MKSFLKTPFWAVAIILSNCAYGQNSTLQASSGLAQFYVGAEFSLIPFSANSSHQDEFAFATPLQFSTGLNLNFKLKNRFNSSTVLKTGVLFDVLNTNSHLSRSTADDQIEQCDILCRKHYVGVPILLGHSAHLTEKTCYVFRVGLVIIFEIGNHLEYTANGNWELALAERRSILDNEKGWNAPMLYLSYGFERELNRRLLLQYELYWQHRFSRHGFYNAEAERPFRPFDVIGINIGLGWIPN